MYGKYLVRSLIASVLWGILGMPTTVLGQYTFGEWARDHGYSPGDVMPKSVGAHSSSPPINSLDGIGEFNWNTTPTETLSLGYNQISSIESGSFIELTNLRSLLLYSNNIASIESGAFNGLTNLTQLHMYDNQITSIESGAFSELSKLTKLDLSHNQILRIEPYNFSELSNLKFLDLSQNTTLTKLILAEVNLSSLTDFSVMHTNLSSVSLRCTIFNQSSLNALLYGGSWLYIGIGELPGITELDLSGVDFVNSTDLSPLYVMDDLTDLWLVDTQNLDALQLDLLLDNLATIDSPDTEGILYMTQANFDAFNTAGGGLLAAWDAEPGHHVENVPEPASIVLFLLITIVAITRFRMKLN
ncbi:MAG: leucine-rich repeat domain-containing protein [Pirellulales bacterium]|nr:leucine-rich repeat domain-containing protein [Pirellulales bacterium]